MEYNEAKEYVVGTLSGLEEQMDEWRPMQTRADARAYEILGTIHETVACIDDDPVKRVALVDVIRKVPDVSASKKWSASGKSSAELIVTFLLGLKTNRSRKHNWVSTLAHAAECETATTKAAFIEWISSKDVGGIEGAVAAYRGDDVEVESLQLSDVAATLEEQNDEAEMIKHELDPDAPAGLGVLIVRRASAGEVVLLRETTEEAKIKRVLVDLGILKRPRKRTRAQIATIEREAVLALNRVTFALASGSKVTKKRIDTFGNAYRRLKNVPELVEKYFDGRLKFEYGYPDHESKGGKIEPQNEQFDKLDPGRYLGGARERALIPYKFDPANHEANRKAALEYLHRFDKPPVEEREPVKNPATVEPFIEDKPKPATKKINEKLKKS